MSINFRNSCVYGQGNARNIYRDGGNHPFDDDIK